MTYVNGLLLLALLAGIGVLNDKNIKATARRLVNQCANDR